MRTHYKFRKIRSFLRQEVRTSASEEFPPCPQSVRTEQPPFPLDYGRLLWTAPNLLLSHEPLRSVSVVYTSCNTERLWLYVCTTGRLFEFGLNNTVTRHDFIESRTNKGLTF